MALIRCPDCKAEDVSDRAVRCPKCGRDRRERSALGWFAKGLFLLFNGVMVVAFIVDEGSFEITVRWAAGAVIFGMFALVTKGLQLPAPPRQEGRLRKSPWWPF